MIKVILALGIKMHRHFGKMRVMILTRNGWYIQHVCTLCLGFANVNGPNLRGAASSGQKVMGF